MKLLHYFCPSFGLQGRGGDSFWAKPLPQCGIIALLLAGSDGKKIIAGERKAGYEAS
jgi:hypothetical protein